MVQAQPLLSGGNDNEQFNNDKNVNELTGDTNATNDQSAGGGHDELMKEITRRVDELSIPFTERTGDFRAGLASNFGGFELRDQVLLGKHRSVISEMVSVSEKK